MYRSDRSAYRRGFQSDMTRRLAAASSFLSGVVKSDISQPGTLRYHPVDKKTGRAKASQKTVYNFTHSRPGNPPFKQKGNLRKSVAYEVVGLVGRVGSNLKQPRYPLYLELGTRKMGARPYLRSNLKKYRRTLLKILGGTPGVTAPISSNQYRSGHFGRGAKLAGWA